MPDMSPDLFQLLRGDIKDMRQDFNDRLDKLVSTDAFAAEQRRRDELHGSLVQDIADERVARERGLAQESATRDAQVAAERDARMRAHEETDKRSAKVTNWLKWTIGTLIAAAAVAVAVWAVVVK